MSSLPPLKLVVAALIAVVAIAAIALTRDSDEGGATSSSPVPVPEDYATFEGELEGRQVSFAYPEEWGEVETREGAISKEVFFEIQGPPDGGPAPAIKVGLQLESDSPEAILQANLAQAQFASEVDVTTEGEETEVTGAVEALRAEVTYPVEAGSSEEEFQSLIVVGSAPDETAVSLTVSGNASDPGFDLEAVASSLEIEIDEVETQDA